MLEVLTMVPYTMSENSDHYHKNQNISVKSKEKRMEEIMRSLQNTLNHPIVRNVHIFCKDKEIIPYIQKQRLNNSQKIHFVINGEDTMLSVFQYVNRNLDGKLAMIINADNYPVEGFTEENLNYINSHKIMYSLSR